MSWMQLEDIGWGRRWEDDVHGSDCNQVNQRALGLMTEKLIEAGIDTVVVATPILRARRLPELDKCLKLIVGDVGAHTVLSRDLPLFTRRDFHDHMHLRPSGRLKLSDALVPHVRRVLDQKGG